MPRRDYSGRLLIGAAALLFLFFVTAVLPARASSPSKQGINLPTVEDGEHLTQPPLPQVSGQIHGFDLLNAYSGWIWQDDKVFWTDDGGNRWRDITPSVPDSWVPAAVFFPSTDVGFVLLVEPNLQGWLPVSLAMTNNAGREWQFTAHPFSELNDDQPPVVAFEMFFLDENHGWLTARHLSSSNFSLGSLFITQDGGKRWTYAPAPIAGKAIFVNPHEGWLAGGATGDELFRSQDGGITWSEAVRLPDFDMQSPLDSRVNLQREPAAVLQKFSGQPVELPENELIQAETGWRGMQSVDFADADNGWGVTQTGNCVAGAEASAPPHLKVCTLSTDMLRTEDGGRTWQALSLPRLPFSQSFLASGADHSPLGYEMLQDEGENAAQSVSGAALGQGFDKCEVPTLSQLQAWRAASPYQSVNLYIGGVMRACDNLALNAAFVNQARTQGWSFIPTWVGPQASCTDYRNRMSSDPAVAYNQGVNEANAAVETAAALGLTTAQKTGAVIYYDLEYYNTTKTTCNEAAKAFINGWVTQMHARGNIAGVYSNGPPLYQFSTIPNPPDVIWAAHWIYSGYNPAATVWNVYSLPNTLWANHQRLRQYAGGHKETWGSVSMNIDSNVLDGVVSYPLISYENLVNRFFLPLIYR